MTRWISGGEHLDADRGDGRSLFRLAHTAFTTEEDWRSHYELGEKPRKAEIENAMDHMGVSLWSDREICVRLARMYGDEIGRYLIELTLDGALGIWFAETGPPEHYTVWGRPAELQRSSVLPGVAV